MKIKSVHKLDYTTLSKKNNIFLYLFSSKIVEKCLIVLLVTVKNILYV